MTDNKPVTQLFKIEQNFEKVLVEISQGRYNEKPCHVVCSSFNALKQLLTDFSDCVPVEGLILAPHTTSILKTLWIKYRFCES